MPFNDLAKKMCETFSPDTYAALKSRIFFVPDEKDYSSDREQAKVMQKRMMPESTDTTGKIARAEARFGWLCGMDRDRLVQAPTNYSEIMRNNCVLRSDVYGRLYEARLMLSSEG